MPRKKAAIQVTSGNPGPYKVRFRLTEVRPRKHKAVVHAASETAAEQEVINACVTLGLNVDILKVRPVTS